MDTKRKAALAAVTAACLACVALYAAGAARTPWTLASPRRRPFLNAEHGTDASPLIVAGLAALQAALLLRDADAFRSVADACHVTAALVAICTRVTDLQLLVAWALCVGRVHRLAACGVLIWALVYSSAHSPQQFAFAAAVTALSAVRPIKPSDTHVPPEADMALSALLAVASCTR
jgi:hypothetical protein